MSYSAIQPAALKHLGPSGVSMCKATLSVYATEISYARVHHCCPNSTRFRLTVGDRFLGAAAVADDLLLPDDVTILASAGAKRTALAFLTSA